MKLINKEELIKLIRQVKSLSKEEKEIVKSLIEKQHEVPAISIEWFHKNLIDMLYNQEISSDNLNIFHRVIAKWKEVNK